MVCYIRKYVIILRDIPVDVPPNQNIGGVPPASPAGLTPVPSPDLAGLGKRKEGKVGEKEKGKRKGRLEKKGTGTGSKREQEREMRRGLKGGEEEGKDR